MNRLIVTPVIIAAMTTTAYAEDIAAPAATEKCFPVKGIAKYYKKMGKLKPARLDTLEAVMSANFVRENEAISIPKFWARNDDVDTPFAVAADGSVTDFHAKVRTLPEEAELCGEVLTPEGEESKIGMSMGSDIVFQNRTGPYSLAELQDGVADGKSLYKKMMPGPMALLVPKMTHISLEYNEDDAPLEVIFTQAGQAVSSPPIENFGGTFVISLEDIEASGADTMTVGGGEFKLMPTPSVKKMKSLGFSAEDEEDTEKKNGD